ncbi:ABC transporter ATP-binding protein [Streptomyces scabichelini]|uniref:ABC transporter ATP-binding protein n=1 Tax=Streptomyces scabichelini TaxID=2711217 RepID=UPI001F498778|nr:ABC transporter transmembrane domain-containing protein [Streptomyces scabichelini]
MTVPKTTRQDAAAPRLRILWSFARPHRAALVRALLLALVGSALGLATPMVTKWVLDALGESASLTGPVVALLVLLVLGGAVGFWQWSMLGALGERVVLEARESMVRRFLRATVPAVTRRPTGELVTRVTSDTVLLREAATGSLVGLINGTIMLVGTLALMGVLDPVLLGTTVAAVAVIGVLFAFLMPGIATAQQRAQEHIGRLGGVLEGTLRAIRTVKVSRAEDRTAERIVADARASAEYGVRAVRREALAWTIAWSGIQLAIIAILGVGAWRVGEGHLEVSSLIAFLLYAFGLMEPITELSQNLTALQAGIAAAERIRQTDDLQTEGLQTGDLQTGDLQADDLLTEDLQSGGLRSGDPRSGGLQSGGLRSGDPRSGGLRSGDLRSGGLQSGGLRSGDPRSGGLRSGDLRSADPRTDDTAQPVPRAAPAPGADADPRDDIPVLELRQVTAAYGPDAEPAVRGVDLAVPRYGHTAIVGPSGAGKTTLFSLILRFLEPTGGELLLDGRPYRDHTYDDIRARLAYVEQDTPIVPGTIRDNLLLSRPDATDEELRRVLHDVRLAEKIDALGEGLDTPLSSTTVSGGERQRIALARALLRTPDVLLLDEATAQLDGLTEAAVHDCIRSRAGTGAVVTIAHRLSTVIDADTIVVMEAGRIRTRGSHEELLATDSLYRELVEALRIAATTAPAAR